MSYVLVIDQDKRPLDPVHPGRARQLLSSGKAAVYRRYPFVLILKRQVPESHPQPLRLKIDPGSKTTGLAVVNDATGQVVWAADLAHRGAQVRAGLLTRCQVRRGRRHRHTRYRQPRWRNRRRPKGWLAPSLMSRLQNVLTWVERLRRFCPVGAISLELVRFDLQELQNPEIEGLEYQRGTLFGMELRHARATQNALGGCCVLWSLDPDMSAPLDGLSLATLKITGRHGMVEGIHARYCSPIHRNDGYAYTQGKAALPPRD